MLYRMTFDTIFTRCGELLGRFLRGRQQDIPVPPRMPVTSDPDLHPFELESRDEIQLRQKPGIAVHVRAAIGAEQNM
jgi:hypothetical protein